MADEQKDNLQLVTFQLGEEKYGITIMDVKEIQRSLEIRAIPNAPLYIEGIANLRGTIIPIINLHPPPQMISGIGNEYIQGVVNGEREYFHPGYKPPL